MNPSRRDLLLGAGAATTFAALPARATPGADADARAQTVLDGIAEMLLGDSPESATSLGIDTGARRKLKHQLADRSVKGQKRVADHLRKAVADLDALPLDQLSPTMKLNVDTVRTSFALGLDGFAFPYGDVAVGGWRNTPYVVVQNVGAYLDTPRMLDSDHSVETTDDADAYVDRMRAYADNLDGETQRLKIAAANGVIAPDFLLDQALKQLRIASDGNPAGWGIVTSLANRSAGMKGDFGQKAFDIAAREIKPALDRQIAELERHRARATSDAGVWKFPDGDAYYAWALRAGTTTEMTPDEVHQMGREQLAAIQGEMDTILKSIGYSEGSVGERMVGLAKDPRYSFPEGDEGRAEIMKILRDSVADMHGRMPQAFHTLVRGNVEVKRLPPEEEPGAPGAYGGAGSIDGKIPGRLWINLRTTALWTRYSLPDLAYHEAIPGHAWQGEYSFRLPLARTLLAFNAYSEGWALYAEQLGDELGAYADFHVGKLGYLQSIAFRACRLVVDTGLHAKRWTREQAIQWFHEANGSGIEEVTGEVERYCSWPGQACGYKVGHSEINRLRDHAKTTMGDRYDFKGFNDAVVTSGNVPMTVLGRVVDRYIGQTP